MAEGSFDPRPGPSPVDVGPGLAATYEGGDALLLERLVDLVDCIEICPDSISRATECGPRLDRARVAELKNVSSDVRFLIHGVGLSIASADNPWDAYLRLLDGLCEQLPIAWHSEHLGYTRVGSQELGVMLPPPRTKESFDLICTRVSALRARYDVPFLLEHIVRVLPDCGGDYSEAAFMNALARDAGCGFVVDAYNLECDRRNFDFDVKAFLGELDLSRVLELHLAGGATHNGFCMDSHSRQTDVETRILAHDILSASPCIKAVTFEFLSQAVPSLGMDAITAELKTLRSELLQ